MPYYNGLQVASSYRKNEAPPLLEPGENAKSGRNCQTTETLVRDQACFYNPVQTVDDYTNQIGNNYEWQKHFLSVVKICKRIKDT